MRILVTGGAGFIGSHLCDALIARGDEVVVLDAFDETLCPAAEKRAHLAAMVPAPRLVEGDVCDPAAVRRALDPAPDVVVHLAALAGVRPSLAEPSRYLRANVEGTSTLLEACRGAGVGRFVLASSSSVYGARSDPPFSESDPDMAPISPYSASKRAAELVAGTHARLYGTGVVSLRLFTVYGPRQRPDLAIRRFCERILRGQPIPVFGDGSTARDYTFVSDIVEGILSTIEHTRPGVLDTINLGGTRPVRLADLVLLLEDALGAHAIIDRQPEQAGDVPLTAADTRHAEAVLGWRPRVTLEEGLARFVAWLRAREDGPREG